MSGSDAKPRSEEPRPLAVGAKEAARMLGVSPRTLWTLTNAGEIPVARIGTNGRSLRYRVVDLEAFLEAGLRRTAR